MEEIKEKYIQNSLEPVSINSIEVILNQMKNCVCKIHIKGTKGTGFFTKIPYKNDLLKVLITNNHILDEECIKDGKNISISLNNETIFKNIKIDSDRKRYTNEIFDVTIIEIKEEIDNISDFLVLDNQIIDTYNLSCDENNINILDNIYENESIYILNYINGKEIFASYGILQSINENKIKHKCCTDTGSSGSPILLLKNNKVIGVHYGLSSQHSFNFGTLIVKPIIEFQQMSGNIQVIKKNINSNNIQNKNNIFNRNNINNINYINNESDESKIKNINNESNKIVAINNNINMKKNNLNKNNIINNNKNNDIENMELNIEEYEALSIFEKFEYLIGKAIVKNNITKDILEEFEKICEKLMINDIFPLNLLNKYFTDTTKLLFQKNELTDIHNEKLEKYIEVKKNIYEIIEQIENKLTEKLTINKKNKAKKSTNFIEQFRMDL